MAGIQIPISGDTAGLNAAVAEVRTAMSELASMMRQVMSPAKQVAGDVGAGMRNAATGVYSASGSLKGFAGAASNAGMVIANVAAGAKGLRSAFNFVSGLSPAWKKVAVAAAGVGAAIIGVVGALRVVKAAFSSLLGVASGVWRGIKSGAAGAASSVKSVFSGMTSAIPGGGMLGPLAGLAGAAGAAAVAFSSLKTGLSVAGDLEKTAVALEALTGSAEVSKGIIEGMKDTWKATGTTIADQAATIQKFIALGFDPASAVRLQKNILDVAGAVGMSTSEAALLGSALAQVKAKGVVSMEELRQQIAEKGIPVIEALAAKLGVAKSELLSMVEDGKVPAEALIGLFMNMEGTFGKFVGGANRMGGTFMGLLERIKGAWSILMAEFAAPIADSMRPILKSGLDFIDTFRSGAIAAGKAVGDALLSAFALVRSGKTMELLGAGFEVAVTGAMDLLDRGIRGAVAFLATTLPPIFELATASLRDPKMWEGIRLQFQALGLTLMQAIYEATGATQKAKAAGMGAQVLSTMGGAAIASSGGGVDAGAALVDIMEKGQAAAAKASGGAPSVEFTAAVSVLKSLMASVSAQVEALKASVQPQAGTAGAGVAPTGVTAPGGAQVQGGRSETLTTALGRVGGGGFGMTMTSPLTSAIGQSNTLLKSIDKGIQALKKSGGSPTAQPAIV